jgi:predicted CoA-binding protein
MKKTLVIGASSNPERYSFKATEMLTEYNHEVYPFGVKNGLINQIPIKTEWPTESDFDKVTMYVGEKNQPDFYDKIINLKPKRVVFNPGAENDEFAKLLTQNGIEALNACTLVLLRTNQF